MPDSRGCVATYFCASVEYRRKDIHAPFRGQRQSGIVTPSKYPFVFILLGAANVTAITMKFRPTVQFVILVRARKGTSLLTKGNKAIANHAADGKDLLLFEMLGKGQVQFCGTFNCAGYEY